MLPNMNSLSENRPALEITGLGFLQFARQPVNSRQDIGGRKDRGSQFGPAIDIALKKIGIFEQTRKPVVFFALECFPVPPVGSVATVVACIWPATIRTFQ